VGSQVRPRVPGPWPWGLGIHKPPWKRQCHKKLTQTACLHSDVSCFRMLCLRKKLSW
jgi:hypothetical protein